MPGVLDGVRAFHADRKYIEASGGNRALNDTHARSYASVRSLVCSWPARLIVQLLRNSSLLYHLTFRIQDRFFHRPVQGRLWCRYISICTCTCTIYTDSYIRFSISAVIRTTSQPEVNHELVSWPSSGVRYEISSRLLRNARTKLLAGPIVRANVCLFLFSVLFFFLSSFFFFHSPSCSCSGFFPSRIPAARNERTSGRLAKLGVSFVIYKPRRPSAMALRIEISIRQNDKTGLERSRWINIAFQQTSNASAQIYTAQCLGCFGLRSADRITRTYGGKSANTVAASSSD